jgi:hydrogenase expression/formation protein HypE
MSEPMFKLNCPLPLAGHERVLMAHGGGGRMMSVLIAQIFRQAFDNPELETRHDGAVLTLAPGRLAMSTDSYVIRPLVFPGGDIGTLAVNGTVNDLAMCGARPLYLSAAFILEEGLEIATLWQVALSMRQAAERAGVRIVTGDTKVVERGHGDGLYINTTGIGRLEHALRIAPASVRPGDAVLISGDVGRHGMAVLAARENLSFHSPIESDCAPLADTVMALLQQGIEVHCLRDATRGGLAAVLNEIASDAGLRIDCDDAAIPVDRAVREACELLGLDPLQVANEGCFVAFVAQRHSDAALATLRSFNPRAALIGAVLDAQPGLVTLSTELGGRRILDMPMGELLPRIC